MAKIIVADSSSLIALQNINRLSLLTDVYGEISVTDEVAREFGEPLPEGFHVLTVTDRHKQAIVEQFLDRGEASSIVLFLETAADRLVIDERKGRRYAQQVGISIIGVVGILVEAKRVSDV